MNKISFNILPCPDTNDHEVRILVDDKDFLDDDYLGLDPSSFFSQDNFDKNGDLIIGRCTCGVEGCCDFSITVITNEDTISWINNEGLTLIFDKQDYVRTIHNAKNDHSWEDIKRTAELLTTNMLKGSQTKDGYNFNWTSARIKDNLIVLSYSKNGDQKLFDLIWDGKTDASVVHNTQQFLETNLRKR